MCIGDNIKKVRESRGLKQSELAELVKVSDKTVSSWEINRTEPKMGMIEKICQALNCKKTDIIGEDNNPLSIKDEKDIEKTLQETLNQLESGQNGLMFSGQALDDDTRELLHSVLPYYLSSFSASVRLSPHNFNISSALISFTHSSQIFPSGEFQNLSPARIPYPHFTHS